MQILYVEDDANQAKIVEAMLASEDHSCHITDSGEQAVRLAARNRYDMILLDIMLPDIDGYEVIQRLQSAGVTTPCLIQSGFVDFDELAEKLGPGAHDCLLKPFSKDELFEQMENVRSGPSGTGISAFAAHLNNPNYAPDADSERRETGRVAIIKSAEAVYADDRFACVVLNLSETGAAIRLPADKHPCPSTFKLVIKSGEVHHCELCWSEGDKVGVRFLEPQATQDESSDRLALKSKLKPKTTAPDQAS